MALTAGDRLGPYEVLALLGAGGMGEVYRALDTRLGRSVAIKVLPESVSRSPEHRHRFVREARAIAALNHPNICTLHDVGRSGEIDYLVMELIEGHTLAERLNKGPLPLVDVLRIGVEIANALARAHRAGVLHRDLKPGNVMLTKTGAKLMDFGLARRTVPDGATPLSQVHTRSAPLTDDGRIVGTFQYMAPEQLEGREADTRSDMWALGVTLYEMATGRRAFSGSSTASVISSIMHKEPPPIAELSPMSPPGLDRLVRACLAKDPDARWQNAADLSRELRWVSDGPAGEGTNSSPGRSSRVTGWFILATAATAVAFGILALSQDLARRRAARRVVRTSIPFPGTTDSYITGSRIALAPDGSALAATLPDSSGRNKLYLRALDAFVPRVLETPDGAHAPFWSPDSRNIGYVTDDRRVQRLAIAGGPPQTVCDPDWTNFSGAAWGKRGDILLSGGPVHSSIFRVPATGGTPVLVVAPDTTKGEVELTRPEFLPDGDHFVFAAQSDRTLPRFTIRVGSLSGGRIRDLLVADSAPRVAPDGTLLFLRDRALLAQRASRDGSRLLGPAQVLEDEPERKTGWALTEPGACATSELMAYSPRDRRQTRLQWLNRAGSLLSDVARIDGELQYPSLSPDDARAILHYANGVETNLWLVDLRSGDVVQMTPSTSIGRAPVWFPDGARFVFNFMGARGSGMAIQRADDPESFQRVVSGEWAAPWDMLSESGPVLFTRADSGSSDIWVAFPDSAWRNRPYAASARWENAPHFLLGGRFVVFEANYNGRVQFFADSYPVRGHLVALTTEPVTPFSICVRGNEIFYLAGDNRTLRSLTCSVAGARLEFTSPKTLFSLPPENRGLAVSHDGQRFLVASPAGAPSAPSVTLVRNWRAALRKPK